MPPRTDGRRARQASGTNANSGFRHILDGIASSTSTDRTNQRILAQQTAATSSITGKAPASTVVSDAVGAAPSGGTVATIGANARIYAGTSVGVRAIERLSATGIVGGIQGGIGAVGASVLIVNVKANTEATILAGAEITAGASSPVTVTASYDESLMGVAFQAGFGFIALGAQVVILKSDATQTAAISTTAKVESASSVTVAASATREMLPLTVGLQIAGASAGAGIAIGTMTGNTSATVGTVPFGGTGTVGSLTVSASSDLTVDAYAVSVVGGGLALSAAVALATLKGTTAASATPTGSIGSGGISATATRPSARTNALTCHRRHRVRRTVAISRTSGPPRRPASGTNRLVAARSPSMRRPTTRFRRRPGRPGRLISIAVVVRSPRCRRDLRLLTDVTGSTSVTVRAWPEQGGCRGADRHADRLVAGVIAVATIAETADIEAGRLGRVDLSTGAGPSRRRPALPASGSTPTAPSGNDARRERDAHAPRSASRPGLFGSLRSLARRRAPRQRHRVDGDDRRFSQVASSRRRRRAKATTAVTASAGPAAPRGERVVATLVQRWNGLTRPRGRPAGPTFPTRPQRDPFRLIEPRDPSRTYKRISGAWWRRAYLPIWRTRPAERRHLSCSPSRPSRRS
jgi:hypothetical protein